ncbi:MAG: thrombospondin type 3 repeat-containing protein [Myxococcales bacterium]|nr:thrombospondin type 3 repeat-containing protein [Myxococcales bacterium]
MRIIRRGLWAAAAWVLAACSGEPARTPEVDEVGQRVLGDHDDDGVLDEADLDDDNDGILDQVECPAPTLAAQEFWVMFNPNNSASGRRDVHVAGAAGTMVTIAGAAPVAIPASGILTVDTGLGRVPAANTLESGKSFQITSNAPVQVFANNFQPFTVDAFTVVPVQLLGTDYRAIGYPNSIGQASQVSVYATEDNTTVTIAGLAPFVMNRGQSYLRSAVGDATGLRVTADKPVAVNSGDACLNTGAGACDHVEEMLFPVDSWSSDFFIPTIPQGQNFRVVAATDGTQVTVDGAVVGTINAGQFYSGSGGGHRVQTSHPAEVYIIALGDTSGTGDPAFILMPGAQNGVGSATFSALAADNVNTLAISMPTAAVSSLRLDGAAVSPTWTAYPSGGYSYAQITVAVGSHTLTADQAFIPVVWGEKSFESYGYVAGYGYPPGTCTTDTDNDGQIDSFDRDSDGDGIDDVDESGGTDANNDGIADGPIDGNGVPTSSGGGTDPPDTDGDGTDDNRDPDSDNDGVLDTTDTNRTNANVCRDVDADTCDDCSVTGANNSGGNVANDGPDADGDGQCNASDGDDDNDGVVDAADSNPTDANVCRDVDADTCDDCSVTGANGSGGNVANDGADNDGDGQCNGGDGDDDNDGAPDASDSDDGNPNVCSDSDADTCDDCSGGSYNPASDGADSDGDGQCNAGDGDDDNDGAPDASDSDDSNPNVCSDTDGDSCEDCSSGTFSLSADGPDNDGDGACNAGDADDDNDGAADDNDADDTNPNVCSDADGDSCEDCSSGTFSLSADGPDNDSDGACNAGDADDDNDGAADDNDADDTNPNACSDVDGDTCDDCALGTFSTAADGPDNDGDGTCNAGDADDDDDGAADDVDADDSNPNVCSDVDGDTCDDCATGTYGPMNDGADADGDGQCDAGDTDNDGDGANDDNDSDDANPLVCSDVDGDTCEDCSSGTYAPGSDGPDQDADGSCDAGDTDDDGDSVPDGEDNCPLLANPGQEDANEDGVGNVCQDDADGDGVQNAQDNCPLAGNADQMDTDADGTGNLCDSDDDGDNVIDDADNCPLLANADQRNTDGAVDGGDLCDGDDDNDGVADGGDNCALVANSNQADYDSDGAGDACDATNDRDIDGDATPDVRDNCPDDVNGDQRDADADGQGDVCDVDDNDDGFEDGISAAGGGCSAGGGAGGSLPALGAAMMLALLRRRRRRAAVGAAGAAAAGLAGLGAPSVATAQTMPQLDEAKDFSAERFQLSSSRDGILNVESATVRSQGSWDVHLWMGDANDPLTLTTASDGERVGSLVKNRFGGELGGSMVVLPYLAVAIDLPLILAQDRDSTLGGVTTMLDDIGGVGVGDLRISPKLRLLRRARSGVDLALRAQLTLPTGSTDNYRGEDGLSLSPSAMLSSRRGAMRWAVDLGYLMRRQTQVADLRVDDEVRLQLGGAYRVARPAEVGATLSVATAANDLFATAARNHSELSAGPSFEVGSQWVVFAAAGLGLQNGYGTPDWRALAGLRIGRLGAESVSDESDGDRDRLFGAADQCPGDAEDYDGFQDTDGCPDVDNDGDGVADVADRAPMEPEDKDGFQDDDGAPDPDNDGDGLADAGDQCPGERETQNGYQDGDGCPDQADGDGDGLADGQDACAEAAEDKDGFEDGDGCPELDNDDKRRPDRPGGPGVLPDQQGRAAAALVQAARQRGGGHQRAHRGVDARRRGPHRQRGRRRLQPRPVAAPRRGGGGLPGQEGRGRQAPDRQGLRRDPAGGGQRLPQGPRPEPPRAVQDRRHHLDQLGAVAVRTRPGAGRRSAPRGRAANAWPARHRRTR